MAVYSIGIVGESFDNDDGSSRQEEIGRCRAGEPVDLVREPDNPHDPNCVKVLSLRGVQIGNIGRDHPWIAERLDRGAFLDARIQRVVTGGRGMKGVVIAVRTGPRDDWDEVEEEEERSPGAGLAAAGESLQQSGCAMIKGCASLLFLAVVVYLVISVLSS